MGPYIHSTIVCRQRWAEENDPHCFLWELGVRNIPLTEWKHLMLAAVCPLWPDTS